MERRNKCPRCGGLGWSVASGCFKMCECRDDLKEESVEDCFEIVK